MSLQPSNLDVVAGFGLRPSRYAGCPPRRMQAPDDRSEATAAHDAEEKGHRVSIGAVLKRAAADFIDDRVFTLSGALAFYTALSLSPLVVILMYVGAALGPETQQQFVSEIQRFLGPGSGDAVGLVMETASKQVSIGSVSAIIGIVTLVVSATAVFVQLQYTMNWIWDVKANPQQGMVREWLQKRLLSFAMVLAVCFLLLVSLAVSATLRVVLVGDGTIWLIINNAVTIAVYVGLFTMMFRYVPDVRIPWRDALRGGVVTALLFAMGKFGIGRYLGYSSVSSAYGAAGSLIALLVWVYYSSLIVFFGVELTQAYVHESGRRLIPEDHAVECKAAEAAAQACAVTPAESEREAARSSR